MTLPDPPQMAIDPPRRSPLRNLSLVWLVPVIAVLVSLGVAWKSYSDRGVLITISFPTAAGVLPGETVIKFRDVVAGTVEEVRFAKDYKAVLVLARIERELAQTLPADAMFWVVRPVVTARGVSGLSTVLSGVYIEGAWTPTDGSAVRNFAGMAVAPIVQPGRPGTRVTLRSEDGSLLPEGGPVFYHGVEVGRLDVPRVSVNGDAATVEAFINAPYDRFITTATRFWDTSGFSVRIGPGGVDLTVASVGALLSGGVAFDTTVSGGQPLKDDTVFKLFIDETSARQSIFTQIARNPLATVIIFTSSVSGLDVGAPVDYRGLRVGQVTGINAFIDRTASGDKVVRVRTAVDIDPRSLGLDAATGKAETIAFLSDAVAGGLRARLTTTSIFNAALKIELAELPGTPPAKITLDVDGTPILPSVTSDLPDFSATAEGVLQRINALPVEEVMQHAISLMSSIDAIAAADRTRAVPDALAGLLEDSRAFLKKDDTQALPGELRGAVADLRKVVADLQERGAVEKLVGVLESADKAAASVASATTDFPALVSDLRDLAAKAEALDAEQLIASTTNLLENADAFIGTESVRALPADLSAVLAEVQAALKELREGGAVANANAALSSVKSASEALVTATNDLPTLTAELEKLVARANGLVAAYGDRSTFNAETLDLIREMQAAAKAVTQLARAIERNPNSLLIGR